MAVERGLRPDEKPSIKRPSIDINAIPVLESQQPLRKENSMHYLSLVKPQMTQQVLSFRRSSEERKAASVSNHSHTKRSGEGQSMELFPRHPGFAATKSINTRESLLTPSGVGGVQRPASRSPSPAATPHKQSSTQLTIFYNGTVNAYDVPADKAQAIMKMLAGNGNAHGLDSGPNIAERVTYNTGTSSFASRLPIWKAAPTNDQKEVSIALPIPTQPADLPLARKQSLQRFLSKRQIRLKSVAPYTAASALLP